MPRLASNQAFNKITGLARQAMDWARGAWPGMKAGYRADAAMVGRGAQRVGRALSWPYRGSFERGAVFTGAAVGGMGAYAGGRWLYNKLGMGGRRGAMDAYRRTSPRGRKAMDYMDRNFG